MSFLLKIVEGPNRGAQIALVEGVSVTLGRGDDCDIVLADSSMGNEPFMIVPTSSGVTINGSELKQFEVMTLGDTAIAVGPSEGPWGELVWPKKVQPSEEPEEAPQEETPSPAENKAESPKTEEAPAGEQESTGRKGHLGCIIAIVVVLAVLAALVWFFRNWIRETETYLKIFGGGNASALSAETLEDAVPAKSPIVAIAEKYGLECSEDGDVPVMSGNLKTRRERLAATAEAYAARPGIELDITDDESFRAAAEDILFNLTEGAVKVAAATNRVLSISGSMPSPAALEKLLRALNDDLPRLSGVESQGIAVSGVVKANADGQTQDEAVALAGSPLEPKATPAKSDLNPSLPVCGILTVPYPCLVMRDGRRLLEGSVVEDSVIVKIEADSVVLANSTGRFIWRP